MSEHKYAQALRWIADGKDVQVLSGGQWVDPFDFLSEASLGEILVEVDGYEFRLKPSVVLIGDVECESPVREPVDGQQVWYWDDATEAACDCLFHGDWGSHRAFAKRGRLFATAAAAHDAHNAITKLLTTQ